MKTKKKLNRSCLLLAICLTLTLLASTVPAEARSTTGWNSWTIRQGNNRNASCMFERFGAVVNGCKTPFNLTFEMVVDSTGVYNIGVVGAQNGRPFRCAVHTFFDETPGFNTGYFWVNPGQQSIVPVNVDPGYGMTLYCDGIPAQSGVASLNWIQ
jgi:hypothetical protein